MYMNHFPMKPAVVCLPQSKFGMYVHLCVFHIQGIS